MHHAPSMLDSGWSRLVLEVSAWTWFSVVGRAVLLGALGQRHLPNALVVGMQYFEDSAAPFYTTDRRCQAVFFVTSSRVSCTDKYACSVRPGAVSGPQVYPGG